MLIHLKLKDVYLSTRSQNYDNPESTEKGKKTSEDQAPLHIEKPDKETTSHIPKGVYKRKHITPMQESLPIIQLLRIWLRRLVQCLLWRCSKVSPHSTLHLLSAIGVVDSSSQLVMKFDATDVRPCLPYHVAFHIGVVCNNILVKRTIVDEGASTCVMSLSCWKAIGSPELTPSPTLLTAFDGCSFRPHGMIPSCPVTLGGKFVCIEVEVVDTPLDYNMLLGRSWTYAMTMSSRQYFGLYVFPMREEL
jgi:hypothetical protein